MSLIILHKFCGFSSVFIYLFIFLQFYPVLRFYLRQMSLWLFSNLLIPFFFCHSTSTRHVYFILSVLIILAQLWCLITQNTDFLCSISLKWFFLLDLNLCLNIPWSKDNVGFYINCRCNRKSYSCRHQNIKVHISSSKTAEYLLQYVDSLAV